MNGRTAFAGMLALAAVLTCAHARSPQEFEVASIKPNSTGGDNWSSRTPNGGWLRATSITTRDLLLEAFGIRKLQLVGVPSWCEFERYDIVARLASSEQIAPEEVRPLRSLMRAALT